MARATPDLGSVLCRPGTPLFPTGGLGLGLEGTSDMVEREARRLEVLRRRQERELQQLIEHEVTRRRQLEKAESKVATLERRAEEQRRARDAAAEEWGRQQWERALAKKKVRRTPARRAGAGRGPPPATGGGQARLACKARGAGDSAGLCTAPVAPLDAPRPLQEEAEKEKEARVMEATRQAREAAIAAAEEEEAAKRRRAAHQRCERVRRLLLGRVRGAVESRPCAAHAAAAGSFPLVHGGMRLGSL